MTRQGLKVLVMSLILDGGQNDMRTVAANVLDAIDEFCDELAQDAQEMDEILSSKERS